MIASPDAPTGPLPAVPTPVSIPEQRPDPDQWVDSEQWVDPHDDPLSCDWVPGLAPQQPTALDDDPDDDPHSYGHLLEDRWPIHGPFTREAAASAAAAIRYLKTYLGEAARGGGALVSAPDIYAVLHGLQGSLNAVEDLLTNLTRFMWEQSEDPDLHDNRIGFDGSDTAVEVAEMLTKCRDALPWFRVPMAIATETASHLRCDGPLAG